MRGVDKMVLVCIEIPLVLAHRAGGIPALDANLLLAEAADTASGAARDP